jgi:hypothetical protein
MKREWKGTALASEPKRKTTMMGGVLSGEITIT